MSVLGSILAASAAGAVLSVIGAALFAFSAREKWVPILVSYAIGALLGAVFLEILPHAIELHGSGTSLGAIMLGGILLFFVLEKAVLWRHTHHHGEAHPHSRHDAHGHASAVVILIGDTVHNFIDGIIIAAAFISDPRVGWLTALAIIAHEIPQEVGDFLVLLHSGYSKARAFFFNIVSSLAMVVGALLAYFGLQHLQTWIAPLLGLAAASLLYVAVADLIPALHKRLRFVDTLQQVALIALGLATIWAVDHVFHPA